MSAFSIVVFAKNEEENIRFVVDQILEKYTADQIIFVLDGELEGTVSILSSKNIKFIKGPGQGKGAAIQTAIRDIDSDVLVFMDTDGSHDPNEIESLLTPLLNDKAEMVIGSRFLGSSDELGGNAFDRVRYLGNVTGNVIINTIWNRTDKKISDAQNGFRSVRRKIFLTLALQENSFSIEQEMVIKCLKRGYRILEVPSHERRRKYGQSHISTKHLINFIGCFIKNI